MGVFGGRTHGCIGEAESVFAGENTTFDSTTATFSRYLRLPHRAENAHPLNGVNRAGPDSFGNMTTMTGSESSRNPFRFSTKYTDDETELVYYGFRYYSPETGRWVNRDPIGEFGGANLFSFVLNAPPNAIDTLGLRCNIAVLFGHGDSSDSSKNWLFWTGLDWARSMDDCDGLALYGCKSELVWEQILRELKKEEGKTDDDVLALLARLALMRIGGTTTGDVRWDNALDLWREMGMSIAGQRDRMCDNIGPSACCCKDVHITFICQRGDQAVADDVALIMRDAKILEFVRDVPPGDDFCGKTWSYNCESAVRWQYEGEYRGLPNEP